MVRLTFDGNFCDISQCRELPCPYDGNCTQKQVWERLKAYENTNMSPQTCARLAETVNFLKEQNQKLGATLLQAMRDMEKLDACEICKYGQTDKCTAPKELKLGGSCFCWRGKAD